jgi:putative phosphonate metabolism protein
VRADEARFAIYFAPRPESALGCFGCAWLGRDAASGKPAPRLAVEGFSAARLAALTAEPARYGWHATLKPPFRLASGQTLDGLLARLAAYAAARPTFEIPGLKLGSLGGFLALLPSAVPPPLTSLAEDCVRTFDAFRAPASPDELARRRGGGLTARQETLLARWGYPYVLEEFRFHLTLTARLEAAKRRRLAAALVPLVAPLCRAPVPIDSVSLFAQEAPNAAYCELRRFPFAGA